MEHVGILLILGIGVFGGILGATLFQKFKIPQVVGYIIIGLIIGQSGMGIISSQNVDHFGELNHFALGIIGFLVGGELQIETFKKYGRQFIAILLGEGLLAFALVAVSVYFILYSVTSSWQTSLALSVVFGAIASATDPASTVSVLWEYRAKGILTTSVTAIVALDDALAMTLYGIGTAVAQMLTSDEGSITHELLVISKELGGAVLAGVLLAILLNWLLRRIAHEKSLVMTTGTLLLLLGICQSFGLDSILAAMTLGFTITNKSPRRTEEIFSQFRILSGPIYVIFFVLVGARINFAGMPPFLWGIVLAYIIMRSIGKVYGAKIGAKYAKSDEKVQKYLGQSLFAQGGIAIGLSATAGSHLNFIQVTPELGLGDVLVYGITTTTLLVQLLGPAMVKAAIYKAGENNRDVNEHDIISELKVKDVIQGVEPVKEVTPLSDVIRRFSEDNILSLPVVDDSNKIVGSISIDNMKELLSDQESWNWILTTDVMEPLRETFYMDTDLHSALNTMKKINVEQVPVLKSKDDKMLVGLLTIPYAKVHVSREMVKRHKSD